MPVRVVVITDRRLVPEGAIASRIAAMLASAPRGSVLIQIREKDLDGGPLLALARAVLAVARPAGAPVWINDRLDVALVAGADGVHLPEHGLTIDDARRAAEATGRVVARGPGAASAIGGPLAIGCSRHTAADVLAAAEAGPALVQFGPVWEVSGKGSPIGVDALGIALPAAGDVLPVGGSHVLPVADDVPAVGGDVLPAADDVLRGGGSHVLPVVAVGGIDGPARAHHAAMAGASAVAVIRAAWHGEPGVIGTLVEAVEAGLAARSRLPS